MKISITCGLSDQATVDFTEPISNISSVAKINLFRKSETPSIKKFPITKPINHITG